MINLLNWRVKIPPNAKTYIELTDFVGSLSVEDLAGFCMKNIAEKRIMHEMNLRNG